MRDRRAFLELLLAATVLPSRGLARQSSGGYHVYPKDRIQDAIEAAAKDRVNKTVYVHAGTYRPSSKGQALVWFNARHDGVKLQAVGDVTLTAANPDIADPQSPSFPAVV